MEAVAGASVATAGSAGCETGGGTWGEGRGGGGFSKSSERGGRWTRPRDEKEGRRRRFFVHPRNTSWCLVGGSGGGARIRVSSCSITGCVCFSTQGVRGKGRLVVRQCSQPWIVGPLACRDEPFDFAPIERTSKTLPKHPHLTPSNINTTHTHTPHLQCIDVNNTQVASVRSPCGHMIGLFEPNLDFLLATRGRGAPPAGPT
jgi:hypothetical protein